MKIRYYKLDKKTRKKAKEEFFKTKKGQIVKKNLNTTIFISIMCFIWASYLVIDYIVNNLKVFDLIYAIGMYFIGIIFLIFTYNIKIKKINEYIVDNKI